MRRFLTDIYARFIIRIKYRKGFASCDKVLTLGRKIMSSHDKGMVWDHADDFSKVLILALAQNIHRLQSIRGLAAMGLAKDAIPLIRSMFEDFANMHYMYTKKESVKDFIDYGIFLQIRSAEGLLASGATFDRSAVEQKMKSLNEQWQLVRGRFLTKKGGIHERWNKKSLADTCKEVDLWEVYNTSYRYFSGYVHLNSLNVNNYVEGLTDDGMISVTIGTSEAMVNEALHVGAGTFIGLLGIASDEHKMGFENELEKVSLRLHKRNVK